MRVFVSSLISGMEDFRAAARAAVTTLRHEPVMAEEFGAQSDSPQIACLTGLRKSDILILILGEHYGAIQPSGMSATHEEYREAKGQKPIVAFVQQGVSTDSAQAAFVAEVQGWEAGLFRAGFGSPSELNIAITRALHDYELANAAGPVDTEDLMKRSFALLPEQRHGSSSGAAAMNLAVAGGPRQSILRPIELEKPALADWLHQTALFGATRLFDPAIGVQRRIDKDVLSLVQERGRARILLNEQGSVLVTLPIRQTDRMMPELIEEFIQEQLSTAIEFASGVLDHIDSSQRLTQVCVAASISDADYMGWRTRQESAASPNSMRMGFSGGESRSPVQVNRKRAALRLDTARLVEDLIVPLRRQWG